MTDSCSTLSSVICTNKNELVAYPRKNESHGSINLQNANVNREEQGYKTAKLHTRGTVTIQRDAHQSKSYDKNNITLSDVSGFDSLNNNISKPFLNYNTQSAYSVILNEEINASQAQSDSTQYLLIAAAHISAAFIIYSIHT